MSISPPKICFSGAFRKPKAEPPIEGQPSFVEGDFRYYPTDEHETNYSRLCMELLAKQLGSTKLQGDWINILRPDPDKTQKITEQLTALVKEIMALAGWKPED